MNPAPAPQPPARDLAILADEITELAAHLNAATYRLLSLIAEHGTASHVERLVRNYRKVKRSEALERDNRQHELRELKWYVDDDGSVVFKGRLGPEQGARLVQALDAALTALREEQRDAAEDVSAGTPVAALRADALQRITDGYLGSDQVAVNGGDDKSLELRGMATTSAREVGYA